jgi:pimeloyl-ACP methyl ester carboxylesterase
VSADGSDVRQLTNQPGDDYWATWSPDGTQIAFASERDGNFEIYVMNADGSNQQRLTMERGDDLEPAWSPDGTKIAYMYYSAGRAKIYIMDVDGGSRQQLTESEGDNYLPTWSPDGTQIVFVSEQDGNPEIYIIDVEDALQREDTDGGKPRRLTNNDGDDRYPAWSPDGTQISFFSVRDEGRGLYVMDVDGSNLKKLTPENANVWVSAWSPDGTKIAFTADRDGNREIYVQDVESNILWRLTDNRVMDGIPAWQPDPLARPAYVPIFEQADCQFQKPNGYEIECGYLIVPEDRSQIGGPHISLHIAIFKSTNPNPEPDPVVHLVGGPGGSLLDDADAYLRRGGIEILRKRDYIMLNQRGTHYATPFLECPGRTEFQWELAGQGLPLDVRNQQEAAFLLECQDDLLKKGINLSAYNSAESAADINDLRIALGYEQINLYGVSYGSRLALAMMRDEPASIRSVIIDAVLPPQANLNQDITLNFHRALNAVFDDCAADTYCNQTYPDLESTFYQVVDELNANPVSIVLDEGTVVVDGYTFLDTIFMLLYSVDAIPWIPYLIDQASQGRYPETSIFGVPDRRTRGPGMRYAVWCREEMAFESQEQAFALASDLPAVLGDFFAGSYDWSVCESWQAGVADPIENQAVISDIPTLVFSGRYDPVTPPAWGQLAAENLANSFFFEFSNMAHGVMRSNSCALDIGLQFLDDPTTKPDSSCMNKISSIHFK